MTDEQPPLKVGTRVKFANESRGKTTWLEGYIRKVSDSGTAPRYLVDNGHPTGLDEHGLGKGWTVGCWCEDDDDEIVEVAQR